MRGVKLKFRTSFATINVMSANSSAVGLKLTVVSAKNKGPLLVSSKYIPAIFFTPSSVPIICNAGRMASA